MCCSCVEIRQIWKSHQKFCRSRIFKKWWDTGLVEATVDMQYNPVTYSVTWLCVERVLGNISIDFCMFVVKRLAQSWKFKRLKVCIALHGNPSQSYGASLAIWDHTVLPATRYKWMRPALTSASQAGTRFTYPGGMEGWVDLGSLITAQTGIEPMIAVQVVAVMGLLRTRSQWGSAL